ncbi:uncharacterized protein RSE6_07228 [Rhynchosporium secalis]|uniref:Uncharacterized protein n=1 Tax=Rhynchosporium secalis TaxID=38038 RepID=A0A1E1MCI1_RHYSE|nr:uncharacterized protein RSE6_07228 [Rhynchosporium secalis]
MSVFKPRKVSHDIRPHPTDELDLDETSRSSALSFLKRPYPSCQPQFSYLRSTPGEKLWVTVLLFRGSQWTSDAHVLKKDATLQVAQKVVDWLFSNELSPCNQHGYLATRKMCKSVEEGDGIWQLELDWDMLKGQARSSAPNQWNNRRNSFILFFSDPQYQATLLNKIQIGQSNVGGGGMITTWNSVLPSLPSYFIYRRGPNGTVSAYNIPSALNVAKTTDNITSADDFADLDVNKSPKDIVPAIHASTDVKGTTPADGITTENASTDLNVSKPSNDIASGQITSALNSSQTAGNIATGSIAAAPDVTASLNLIATGNNPTATNVTTSSSNTTSANDFDTAMDDTTFTETTDSTSNVRPTLSVASFDQDIAVDINADTTNSPVHDIQMSAVPSIPCPIPQPTDMVIDNAIEAEGNNDLEMEDDNEPEASSYSHTPGSWAASQEAGVTSAKSTEMGDDADTEGGEEEEEAEEDERDGSSDSDDDDEDGGAHDSHGAATLTRIQDATMADAQYDSDDLSDPPSDLEENNPFDKEEDEEGEEEQSGDEDQGCCNVSGEGEDAGDSGNELEQLCYAHWEKEEENEAEDNDIADAFSSLSTTLQQGPVGEEDEEESDGEGKEGSGEIEVGEDWDEEGDETEAGDEGDKEGGSSESETEDDGLAGLFSTLTTERTS